VSDSTEEPFEVDVVTWHSARAQDLQRPQ
jgi:hypothetical protein